MKKSLLITSVLLCAASMSAQNHNVDINFTPEFVNGEIDEVFLEALYVSEYTPSTSNAIPGTTVSADGKELAGRDHAEENIQNGDLDGLFLTITRGDDGLAYVTCPSEAYIGGQLQPVTKGDIRMRIAYSGSPNRPGDSHDLYVYDMTGIYATVSATAGTKLNGYVVAASCATFKSTEHPSGDPANGKYFHTAFYDFPAVSTDNTPENIQTTGDVYGATNLFTFRRPTKGLEKCDAAGFPCKYFDIVFRGIKAGEKVGLCNYQTLYEGLTPHPYDASASIMGIAGDDANAPVEYFNLQGMRIENPTSGLYIKRQGSITEKILVK